MNTYRVRLLDRQTIALQTMEVRLEKPADFFFDSGQFVTVKLPGDPSVIPGRGTYDFSLASAPHDTYLSFVMRMRDTPFKRHLAALPIGSGIEIHGPYGEMVIKQPEQPLVFLAGGMGIAPFRSMLRDMMHRGSTVPVTLVYANQTMDAAAYSDECDVFSHTLTGCSYIPLITRPEEMEVWDGERGYITKDFLLRRISDPLKSRYYIVGPVRMVIAAKRQVRALGVPEEQIFMEIFTGY